MDIKKRADEIWKCKNIIDFMVKQIQKCSSNIWDVFNVFDKDRSGNLGKDELSQVFKACDIVITPDEFNWVFDMIDSDGSKTISYCEFCDVMEGKT